MSGHGYTLQGSPYKRSCESLTSKGTLCKNYCRENSFYCVQHGKLLLAIKIDKFYARSGENYDVALGKQVEIERQENLLHIRNSEQNNKQLSSGEESVEESVEESFTISYDYQSNSEDSAEFVEVCSFGDKVASGSPTTKTSLASDETTMLLSEGKVKPLTNLTQKKKFYGKKSTSSQSKKRKAEDYIEEYFLEQLFDLKKQRT